MADSASPARASGSRLRLEPLTPRRDSARADEPSPHLLRPGLRIPALPGHEARVDAFGGEPGSLRASSSRTSVEGEPLAYALGHAARAHRHEDGKDFRKGFTIGNRTYLILAIYDGHGGAQAAEFCGANLINYIEQAALAARSFSSSSSPSSIDEIVEAVKVRVCVCAEIPGSS